MIDKNTAGIQETGQLVIQKKELEVRLQEIEQQKKECEEDLKRVREQQNRRMNFSTEQFFSVGDPVSKRETVIPHPERKLLEEKMRELTEEEQELRIKISLLEERIAQENKKQEKEIHRCESYKKFGRELLGVQEDERKRIARELHDSTVQNLTNMVHKTELCIKVVDMDPVRAKLELESMISTIRDTIDEMRGIIYNLRPMAIDDLGLVPTVDRYVKQMEMEHEGMEFLFEDAGKEPKLDATVKLTVFRIIQEACNNAVKHAEASKIWISLAFGTEIELEIKDNGIGFERESLFKREKNKERNFGLSIMKERALLLGADIEINSAMGKGTDIYVRIPFM